MTEEKKGAKPNMPHNIILESRQRMTISGVTEIESFDEQCVLLYCTAGEMSVRGEGLHVSRIDVDTGELNLEGERIDAIAYADNAPVRGGLLGRLFK